MEMIENWMVVSATLIIYGIAFIFVERKKKNELVTDMKSMTYKTAILIAAFQVLSIIPGTSRSGHSRRRRVHRETDQPWLQQTLEVSHLQVEVSSARKKTRERRLPPLKA